MKRNWWKMVAVLIMSYVLVAGLLVPLKPGIASLTNRYANTGDTLSVSAVGYNSHYKSEENSLEAWLKIDSLNGIKAFLIEATDDQNINLIFSIPPFLPTKESSIQATLLIHNERDGTSMYPNAISIKIDSSKEEGTMLTLEKLPYQRFHSKTGFLFPYRNILHETIRNTFFHVALWFAMFILLGIGLYYSIKVLRKPSPMSDIKAVSYTKIAILFGIMGIATGSIWARFTWGTFWTTDIKLNMVAIAMLIYLAYLVLRNSIDDPDKRARVSAVYSLFAFIALIPLLFIIPRLTSSLHPGNGGNPAIGGEDLDSTLRVVFYPAIVGFTLIGYWMAELKIRLETLMHKRLFGEQKID